MRELLKTAMRDAGLAFPAREGGFHIFCHTYGSLDAFGLVCTGRWADPRSADR